MSSSADPAVLSAELAGSDVADRGRWLILAGGTFALWSYSLLYLGVAVVSPAIRTRFHVGLSEVGIALGAVSAGASTSLLLWGMLADRVGERVVIVVGLILAAGALAAGAVTTDFVTFIILLFAAGLFGASVNAASARAVMGWFSADKRGVALGIRQTAVPLGGLAAAVLLPHLSFALAIVALSVAMFSGAAVAAWLVRERPAEQGSKLVEPVASGWGDRRVVLLSGAGVLLSTPQICLVGFAVLFLHDARGVSVPAAAGFFAAIQLIGAATRIGLGWWSDRLGMRIKLIRGMTIALVCAVAATATLTRAPLSLLLPVLTLAGGLALGWNALLLTAAAEFAGLRRAGAALGFQQTGLAVWATGAAPVFALLVDRTSWRFSFLLVAVVAGSAYPLLRRLETDPVAC